MEHQTRYSVSIVIPAYNEEANIEEVVLNSLRVLQTLTAHYEVLVMDDASTDRTGEILDRLCKRYDDRVRFIQHQKNAGTNLSLIKLFRNARYELIFFLPADKQILPDAIRLYIPLIEKENADIVLGWRVRRADPPLRSFLNWLYRMVLGIFFDIHYQDACASDLYKKAVLDQIEMKSRGRFLQAEIATKASILGYQVREVAVDHYPRMAGQQTGVNFKTTWLSFMDLFQVGVSIRKLKCPGKFHIKEKDAHENKKSNN